MLLQYLAERLTTEFGTGFSAANRICGSFCMFPKRNALRSELSWMDYRLLMRVRVDQARQFYLEECVKSGWSSRQLERQIHTMFYQRLLTSQDKASVAAEI